MKALHIERVGSRDRFRFVSRESSIPWAPGLSTGSSSSVRLAARARCISSSTR
jgi:hypothetical protein